jgi:uncharacterized repeat protein (TIGR01451 family)
MMAWKMNVRLIALLGLVCCLALVTQSARAQQTFSFSDFSSTGGTLKVNGNASVVTPPAGPAYLQLTPAAGNQVGSAWYTTQLPLKAGFTTTFTFQFPQVSPAGSGHADGIAFLIHGAPSGVSTLGFTGGAIGYGDDDADNNASLGIPNSVAIEFDTFTNGWDPNNNHVAIQSCGAANNSQHHHVACKNAPSVQSTLGISNALNTLTHPINLSDGTQHTAIITYNPPCAGCQNLTVNLDGQNVVTASFDLTTLGLDANDDAYVGFTSSTGGGFEFHNIISWNFSSQTVTEPLSQGSPTPFVFSNDPNTELKHVVDFSQTQGNISFPDGITAAVQIQSTNTSVDANTWPKFVHGGPLAPSKLFPLADNNTGSDTTVGGLFVDLCFDPTQQSQSAQTPSDANCPSSSSNDPTKFLGITVISDLKSKPGITPGTTSVLAHYHPNTTNTTTWSPTTIDATPNPACVATTGLPPTSPPAATPPSDCDVLDIQQFISGDQTTSSGRSRAKGTFAFAYNVPMLLSTVTVNGTPVNQPPANGTPYAPLSSGLWFSAQQGLTLGFLVNPACVPGACPSVGPTADNNFFSPAPVAGETFDLKNNLGTLVAGPTSATPPSTFNTAIVTPVTFSGQIGRSTVPDGSYLLEWSAVDNIGIQEQNQQLIPTPTTSNCPDGTSASEGACYVTTLFSAQLNVDSTPPTITPVFTPASTGNIFAVGSTVHVSFGCVDALSGIATCLSTGVSGLTDGGLISTVSTQVGTHTFTITATDKAGNTTTQSVQYQIVASSELLLLNLAKVTVNQGSNLTYNIAVLNLGPAVANNVVVTDTLPAGTTFVSAGYGVVSCNLGGCSDLNGPGSACSLSGNTVTCNIPTVGLLFKSFTDVLVKVTVKVTTAAVGSVLSDTAMVRAVNTDPISFDNTATARTEVCSSTTGCPRLH